MNFFQEKQGDISEDDTVRFKSYLMSLGIDDPVTRDAFRSDSDYYTGLAQQISDMMVAVLMVSTYHLFITNWPRPSFACVDMISK